MKQLGKPLGATFLGISILVLLVGGRRYFESQVRVREPRGQPQTSRAQMEDFVTRLLLLLLLPPSPPSVRPLTLGFSPPVTVLDHPRQIPGQPGKCRSCFRRGRRLDRHQPGRRLRRRPHGDPVVQPRRGRRAGGEDRVELWDSGGPGPRGHRHQERDKERAAPGVREEASLWGAFVRWRDQDALDILNHMGEKIVHSFPNACNDQHGNRISRQGS